MSDKPQPVVSAVDDVKVERLRPRPSKVLPTNRVALARQLDILRAYAIHGEGGKPVSNEQVSGTVKIKSETASLCNAFFSDIALIQRIDGGYVPSPEVVSFSRAYDWDKDAAPKKLAPVFERAWFSTALIPNLKFRNMDDAEAISKLADASSAVKDYEAQLKVILEFLSVVGLIVRENGQVRLGVQTPITTVSPYAFTPTPTEIEQQEKAREKVGTKMVERETSDHLIPVPLGRGRLAHVELPEDWNTARDLERFLQILRISLTEDASVVEKKEGP